MKNSIWAVLFGAALVSACVTKPIATLQAVDPAVRSAMVLQTTNVRYEAELGSEGGLDQQRLTEVLGREFLAQLPQPTAGATPRRITIDVEILAYREPNAALAILLGDSSQIIGNVKVLDAESGAGLGEYYIEVIEGAGGVLGLAAADTTENGLGREFVEQFVKHLTDDTPN